MIRTNMRCFVIGIIFVMKAAYLESAVEETAQPLTLSTAFLMTQGGDDRLLVTPETGVNKYYTSSTHQHDVIARSSCTSSFPTQAACKAAALLQQKLLQDNNDYLFAASMHEMRMCIKMLLNVNDAHLVFTPSGSDAEMLFTTLALVRHRAWNNREIKTSSIPLVLNLVLAAGEVGSGTVAACGCRHFSPYVPRVGSASVKVGACIEGIQEGMIEVLQLPARHDDSGVVYDVQAIEQKIQKQLQVAIEEKNQVVVLHMVHASKTGIGIPRVDFVKRMKEHYGQRLVAVVDAAQMRCSDAAIASYIAAGICVLITGSKFFAGPPFCGAVLIPQQEAGLLQNGNDLHVPLGLGDYFTQHDVDPSLTALRNQLPGWRNYGLLLRWRAALYEIEEFYKYSSALRDEVSSWWVTETKKLFTDVPYVHLLQGAAADFAMPDNHEIIGSCNTIISLTLHPAKGDESEGTMLDVPDLKIVHRWMSQDIAQKLPSTATDHEQTIARQRCLIGQPVQMTTGKGGFGVLRLALSAPMVYTMAQKFVDSHGDSMSHVSDELGDDHLVLQKLSLIGKYFHNLKAAGA